jgi:hypothetical protein
MGVQPDMQSVTALMELHNEAIARLKAKHTADLATIAAEITALRKQNANLRRSIGWCYKVLFGCGLFMAYLVKR